MALTEKEQRLDTQGLKKLKKERELAQQLLSKLQYTDTYVESKDKNGKVRKDKDGNTIMVMDKPSELRTLLTSVGVSNTAKNDVIRKIRSASSELERDIKMLTALTS